jgi:hypothetical protein
MLRRAESRADAGAGGGKKGRGNDSRDDSREDDESEVLIVFDHPFPLPAPRAQCAGRGVEGAPVQQRVLTLRGRCAARQLGSVSSSNDSWGEESEDERESLMEEGQTGQLARGGIEALPEVGRVQSETPLVPRGPHTVDTRVSVFGRICLESSVEAPCRTGAAGGGVLWECAGLRIANVMAHVPPPDGEGGYWFQDPIENRWEIESDSTTVSLHPTLPSIPYKVDTSRPSLRTNWTPRCHSQPPMHFLQCPRPLPVPCSSLHGAPDPPLPCLPPSPHRAPRQKSTAPLTRRVLRGVQVRLLRDHTRLVADLISDWGWAPPPRIPPSDPTKARLYFVSSNLQISLALQGRPSPRIACVCCSPARLGPWLRRDDARERAD